VQVFLPGTSISDTILFGFTANASLNKAFGLQASGFDMIGLKAAYKLLMTFFFYAYSHRGIVFRFQQSHLRKEFPNGSLMLRRDESVNVFCFVLWSRCPNDQVSSD